MSLDVGLPGEGVSVFRSWEYRGVRGGGISKRVVYIWWLVLHAKSESGMDHIFRMYTLPETNIAPENRPSAKETDIPTIHFQVLC